MKRWIASVLQALAVRRRDRRRAANLRARVTAPVARDTPPTSPTSPTSPATGPILRALPPPAVPAPGALAARRRATPTLPFWIGVAGVALTLVGGAVLAMHARALASASGQEVAGADALRSVPALQAVLPGMAFEVPSASAPALSLVPAADGVLLVASGLPGGPPVHVDLCSQLLDPAAPRLSPLRIGYRFADVQRWVARSQAGGAALTLRNVLLVADGPGPVGTMPEVQISGQASADFADAASPPLQLSWHSPGATVRWVSDATAGRIEQGSDGQGSLRQQGWLVWGEAAALRVQRRASVACPRAGELVLQLFPAVAGPASVAARKATVIGFADRRAAVSVELTPGRYQVPATPPVALEDQDLFLALQSHGLLRQTPGGSVALVPRDLPLWLASGDTARVAGLENWRALHLDSAALKLIQRLYQHADGAYVRQQVAIYNSELRLLAWRARDGAPQPWQASLDGMPAATNGTMPPGASRLFAELPQGWQPWNRVTQWPQPADGGAPQRNNTLTLPLPPTASGDGQVELLLIGTVAGVRGARLRSAPACTGRACATAHAAQRLWLQPLPGARSIELDLLPLDSAGLAVQGDQRYRHLRMAGGRLVWQPLTPSTSAGNDGAPVADAAQVRLQDRDGTLLWADGAASAPALAAGLATLLGINAEHENSVAGMLARLPQAHNARLSLDLALQTLSQQTLDCVGMRRGRWQDGRCTGGQAAPSGRRAGLVILDAETGDVLAAAGASAAAGAGMAGGGLKEVGDQLAQAERWAEVRDFDRADPARSALRLPAWQHDGGAGQSPGSTFKVVSALGLELAARGEPQLDALLGGLPLPAINRLARQRGFGFQTGAAVYPARATGSAGPPVAHITNYHDQGLDRRARDGRLGLAQALTYSFNTWFAWCAELSDRSLFGRAEGGAPDLQPLAPLALDAVRPIFAAAHQLGFEQALRLDGGLLPADYRWSAWDALQATPSHIDPIHTRHELRQMAIGLRMQATPLQMALVAAAIGQGRTVNPRLLLELDGVTSRAVTGAALDIRLDRIRAGMKGVVDAGTGAGAFGSAALAGLRHGLYGKTGTAPTLITQPDGTRRELATVWFAGWLEPGSLPGQTHRLAMASFVSQSELSGGEHAAPVLASILTDALARGLPGAAPKQE